MIMKTERVMETHTVALVNNELVIHSVAVTTRRVRLLADAEIRHTLDKLARWRPWDDWGHVLSQLKKDRTYLIQNGPANSVKFVNKGRECSR